jgi:hypothetical protein
VSCLLPVLVRAAPTCHVHPATQLRHRSIAVPGTDRHRGLLILLPPCLLLSCSQVSSAKAKPAPYEDRRAPALPAVLSFESQRLMCLSRCLNCLPHYPSDPLSLGLSPFLQCLSSLPFPLSFAQTMPDKQRSKDKTEQDQHGHDLTKQDQTRVGLPSRLDYLRLVLPALPAMMTLPRPQTTMTSPPRRFAPSSLCLPTPFLPCVPPLGISRLV